jgi:4a-hydroxytetrahydrobiopterin dehydratase
MERKKLTNQEIEDALANLQGWKAADDKLSKRFEFKDFAESLKFVNAVGELAEAADHHPDITFGWGYASIELTTHDRNGITDVDVALAQQINKLRA